MEPLGKPRNPDPLRLEAWSKGLVDQIYQLVLLHLHLPESVWFLVGNGGMDYGDCYWGLYRGYYRDPFPDSLLSTRPQLL